MKPEDKVPTREQCQKLVDLGVVLETEKYWVQLRTDKSWHLIRFVSGTSYDDRIFDYSNRIPAPDVAELGEVLPAEIKNNETTVFCLDVALSKDIDGSWSFFKNPFEFYTGPEAQTRCTAYIWLLENVPENLTEHPG